MNYEKILTCAMIIGKKMLISGAEVSRVEDTVSRILKAYGAKRVDVFTITSSMVVTVDFDGISPLTQTRRITGYNTNFNKIDLYNNLSRYICANTPEPDYIKEEINRIDNTEEYGFIIKIFASALIAGAFTMFFGGCLSDAVISALIGALLRLSVSFTEKIGLNMFFSNVILSFLASSLAYISVLSGIGVSADKIIIGNIMMLIPGISLTNSIRDLIGGDIIAGTLRFSEACLIALAIAGGYVLTLFTFGGVIQ